jgi:hypothetical protein
MPSPIQTFTPIHSTVLSSNVSSFDITSIDQTYDHLVITGGFTRNINGQFGGRAAEFRFNGITSGYKNVAASISAGSTSGGAGFSGGTSTALAMGAGNIFYQGGRGAGEIWIPNYRNTTYHKHALQLLWQNDADENSGGYVQVADALIPTTGAISSITIFEQVDSFIAGDWITIYGVKNA